MTTPAKDPRFRPFRVAAYALYLAVVGAFSLLVIDGVVRSVIAMSPGHRPPSDSPLSVGECLNRADALWSELNTERQHLGDGPNVRGADASWTRFRLDWLERLRDAEANCAVRSRSRAAVGDVYDRLGRLMDLHTTHAVQYAGEIGGAVDDFHASIDAARKQPSGT